MVDGIGSGAGAGLLELGMDAVEGGGAGGLASLDPLQLVLGPVGKLLGLDAEDQALVGLIAGIATGNPLAIGSGAMTLLAEASKGESPFGPAPE